jgi:spore germination protein YaaH
MKTRIFFSATITSVIAILIMSALFLSNTRFVTLSNLESTTADDISDGGSGQEAAVVRSKKVPATSTTTSIITQFTPQASAAQLASVRTMAWIYPGSPACSATNEIADGRKIDILKSEFFTIRGGILTLLDGTHTTCNGYSPATITRLKQYSTEQFATVSSADVNDMDTFFASALTEPSSDIDTLVDFTVANSITGIELDFEGFSSWTPESYLNYKSFVEKLGTALHSQGKKLMIDGPAVSSATEEKWFIWRYEDFKTLPVDHIVVMAYDYQYDYGAGSPVAPLDWLKAVINWTSTKYPKERLTIGLPSYGYQGTAGSYRITILTHEQIRKKTGFSKATRDARSGEMTWKSGSTVYFYQDSQSLRQKRDMVASQGITSISIWHLGGNLWF